MKIQILGTGCPKCQKLADITEKAAIELGVEYQLEKVTDMQEILTFAVMSTPALVIDGTVKLSGRVPTVDEAKEILETKEAKKCCCSKGCC